MDDTTPGIDRDAVSEKQTIVLIRDLIFSSKVRAAAKHVGVTPVYLRDAGKLEELGVGRLLVDLNQQGYMEAAVQWKRRTGGHVTGFIAHVAADDIEAARRMGVDQIFSNGGLSANVDTILSGNP